MDIHSGMPPSSVEILLRAARTPGPPPFSLLAGSVTEWGAHFLCKLGGSSKKSVISFLPDVSDSNSRLLSTSWCTALLEFSLIPFSNCCIACSIFLLGPSAVIPNVLKSCQMQKTVKFRISHKVQLFATKIITSSVKHLRVSQSISSRTKILAYLERFNVSNHFRTGVRSRE